MSGRYRTLDVPVAGGALRVGVWDAASDAPVVLLVHGVTASHRSWDLLAERMPGVTLIAPDLRGRGRSADVAGAGGLAQHADDLVAVLDAVGAPRAVVVGHSMGAFISLVLGERHPERVSGVVLVDGGLPLDLPEGMPPAEAVRQVLGPTAARLSMRFATVDDYLDFWRAHPAFARDWSSALEAYLAYDLVGEEPHLRPATSLAVVEADSLDQNTGADIAAAVTALRHPTLLLTAERGLLDQVPALYDERTLPALVARFPGLRHRPIGDVNHYTIVLSPRGADAVASAVRDELVRAADSAATGGDA